MVGAEVGGAPVPAVDLADVGGAGAGISAEAADLSWGAGEGAMAIAALIVEVEEGGFRIPSLSPDSKLEGERAGSRS